MKYFVVGDLIYIYIYIYIIIYSVVFTCMNFAAVILSSSQVEPGTLAAQGIILGKAV